MPIHNDAGIAVMAQHAHWLADIAAQLIEGHHSDLKDDRPAWELRILERVRCRACLYDGTELTKKFTDDGLPEMLRLHWLEVGKKSFDAPCLEKPLSIDAIRRRAFDILVQATNLLFVMECFLLEINQCLLVFRDQRPCSNRDPRDIFPLLLNIFYQVHPQKV